MLKHQLVHPRINAVLGAAGHHATVLIADGNYPASTQKGPNAEVVPLNLSPGVVGCAAVLEALLSAVVVDAVNVMGIDPDDPYARQGDPPIWDAYRRILGERGVGHDLVPIKKWDFYQAVASQHHVLTIQTAEQELWANVLLSIGCRQAGRE